MTCKKGGGRGWTGSLLPKGVVKGGGRESDSHDDQPQDAHGPQHTTHGRLMAGDDSGTRAATPGRAAANPAAFCNCNPGSGDVHAIFCPAGRIRALEAELLGQRPAFGMAISREGFEKRRAEKAESDGRLLGKMLDAQNEKLQKAEARVKELELKFAGTSDLTPSERRSAALADAQVRAEKAEAERDALKERLNEATMWDERREEEIKALQARVKELESGERFTETMFRKLEKAGWKFDELRGEDSG